MKLKRHTELRPLAAMVVAALLGAAVAATALAGPREDDFIVAVDNDRVGQVKEMLAHGMDPDTVNAAGEPALVVAARAGNAATVNLLLGA